MNELETRVREAFRDLEPPADLNERTLGYILDRAAANQDAQQSGSDGSAPDCSAQQHAASENPRAPKRHRTARIALVGFAAAACLALAAAGLIAVRTPVAYVDIDINPSLELSINRFGTVTSAESLNEDGAAVLSALQHEGIELEGARYAEAAGALAHSTALGSYANGESFAQISVICDDAQRAQELQEESEAAFDALPCPTDCIRAGTEDRRHAQLTGMGVGRYLAACELIAQDPSYSLETCANMSMRQIRDALGGESERGRGNGPHSGQRAAREES